MGQFEYLLITTAAGLGDGAYGASIRKELAVATGRRCSLGALYTTIDRLEKKACFKREWATPRPNGEDARSVWFA